MYNMVILLKKDLVSIFRTKKFLAILLVLLGFAILSPVSAKLIGVLIDLLGEEFGEFTTLLGGTTYVESYVQLNSNLIELFIFIIIIMFAGTIIKEQTKGTYLILKMNGVSKKKFVLSHILSQVIVISICYFVSILLFLLTTFIIFRDCFPKNWLYSLFSLYLFIMFFVIFINFVSNFSKSTTQSMIINFSSYFGFLIISMFNKVKWFFPFSLTSNVIQVLDNSITKNNNVALIMSFIWILLLLSIIVIFTKDKISNKTIS